MQKSGKCALLLGAAAAALLSAPALAQDVPTEAEASPRERSVLNEAIVVTAQRREENVQDVPVSITAISGIL